MRHVVEQESKMITLPAPDFDNFASKNAPLCTEMKELVGRAKKGLKRDPMQSRAKVFQQTVFSLIAGAIFFKVGFNNGTESFEAKVDPKASAFV